MNSPLKIVPSSVGSLLSATDPRWLQRTVVEVVSSAPDADKLGIGSAPGYGDAASTALSVPAAATTSTLNRYLFRLCGIEIPQGSAIRILGLRQLATMRTTFIASEENANVSYAIEKEITSPLWSFLNGNISWHLRWQNVQEHRVRWVAGPAGTSTNLNGLDSALLYNTTLVPYTAPGAGVPPGRAVPNLGTWRDMRFPWSNTNWGLDEVIRGPGTIVFYASVYQTDPETRYLLPPVADPGALRPEDRFLQAYPEAIYGHVGGALTVELYPTLEIL